MPALTPLLPNDLVARLERLRLRTQRPLSTRGRGEQLAGRGGASTDFADYRDYAPGDDLRAVDWNAFARLQRPYLKQYRREEERHVAIVVDASRSMAFDGKLERAKALAAALAMIGLDGGDRVSVWALGAGDPRRLSPCSGRASRARAFAAVERIAVGPDAAGVPGIDGAVRAVLARHTGRGLAVLLSDFLAEDDLRPMFNRLFAAGLEPAAVQILAPAEVDPEVVGDLRLIDSETRAPLDVSSIGELLALYHAERVQLERDLATWCAQRQGRFLATTTAEPLAGILLDRMRKGGWFA